MTVRPLILSKNRVKEISIFSCPVENGVLTGKRFIKSETQFDTKGNILELKEYKRGQISKWRKYQYNDCNQLIEEIWYQGTGYDITKYKGHSTKFSYDKNGELLTNYPIVHEKDNLGNRIEKTFYMNGKIRSEKLIDSSNDMINVFEYKNEIVTKQSQLDMRGNLIAEYNFDKSGSKIPSLIMEYDAAGNVVRKKKYNEHGHLKEDRKLQYDLHGNLIEDVDMPKSIYKSHNGEFIELPEGTHSEGYKHSYKYNQAQLIVRHELFLAGSLLMIYKYDYKYHN